MQQGGFQPQHTNLLEQRPHVNTFKLTGADRNQSVYNACHPSFGKILYVFPELCAAAKQTARLTPHFTVSPMFVSTNHTQITPHSWADAEKFDDYCC